MSSSPLCIAFVWHMHQPYYRDLVSGSCSMPWVRLHAAKDYVDMVRILEPFPSIHQTFNVVPSLVEQLSEYVAPSNRSDEFLEISKKPATQLSPQEQRFILEWFFLAHPERMIKPYPRYHDLFAKRGPHPAEEQWPQLLKRFKPQDYLDLQVWFNLVWIDPWLRSQDPRLTRLVEKGSQFSEEEKREVLQCQLELVAQVIPTYRQAAERGQIELSASPYYHPILPLLCDGRSALAALPHMALPELKFKHPEDALWQLQEALARHERTFGARPKGVWPSEGSVSEEVVRIAIEAKVGWIATDEEILWRTLKSPRSPSALYRPHLLSRNSGQTAIVFRDRELSDLIGFVYSQWDPKTAVDDFMKRLTEIYEQFQHEARPALATIILDGENAWEAYPNDGHDFLVGLYRALAADGRFRCVTISEFLQQHPIDQTPSLPELFSGSWIDGNFATWIGHPEKNAAWTLLAKAREAIAHLDRTQPEHQQAWRSLGIAEGSDWMWWFGDTHFSAHADEFDRLFRTHLSNCYQLAGLEIPPVLRQPVRRRAATSLHSPTGYIHPTIDGRETSYYEWLYAGRIDLRQQYAAIHRGEQCLRQLYYGFDETHLYVRLDLDVAALAGRAPWTIQLQFAGESHVQIHQGDKTVTGTLCSPQPVQVPCALVRILEVAMPRASLGTRTADEPLPVSIQLLQRAEVIERYPEQGTFNLTTSTADFEAQAWSV